MEYEAGAIYSHRNVTPHEIKLVARFCDHNFGSRPLARKIVA
jgi:hypothetical protein